jgi:hypothetical protein
LQILDRSRVLQSKICNFLIRNPQSEIRNSSYCPHGLGQQAGTQQASLPAFFDCFQSFSFCQIGCLTFSEQQSSQGEEQQVVAALASRLARKCSLMRVHSPGFFSSTQQQLSQVGAQHDAIGGGA